MNRQPGSFDLDVDVDGTDGRDAALELLAASAYDDGDLSEVIRPAAILDEQAARQVLSELALQDARAQGVWVAEPGTWRRYDQSWNGTDGSPGTAALVGTIQVMYGSPTRHEITIYRATVTGSAAASGWTVMTLCDDALRFAELSLESCPRATLSPPPRPLRFR
ncbi:MAG TPA: hypothetical protein VH274_00650 [Mycobacteriales bacterium]|nr:hypothetical protein [Mycobacteriales bacterium]